MPNSAKANKILLLLANKVRSEKLRLQVIFEERDALAEELETYQFSEGDYLLDTIRANVDN